MILKAFIDHYRTLGDAFLTTFTQPFLLEEGRLDLELDETDRLQIRQAHYLLTEDGSPLTLGRKAKADLRVLDRNVSGIHAQLLPPESQGASWRLVDLGSTNGTFLNGDPLEPQVPRELTDESVLGLGPVTAFVFLTPETFAAILERLSQKLPKSADADTEEHDLAQTVSAQVSRNSALDDLTGGPDPSGEAVAGGVYLVCEPFDPILIKPGQKIIAGRSQSKAHLVLPHPQVSRQHAEFEFRAEGVYVRDLGSSNGVRVSKVKIGQSAVQLRIGLEVGIGDFTIVLKGELPEQSADTAVLTPSRKPKLIRGSFSSVPLSKILAGVEDKQKSGRMEVEAGEEKGLLVFQAGKPWRAMVSNGLRGVAALRYLLKLADGSFTIDPSQEDKGEREIHETFSEVVLEDFLDTA